MQQVQLLPFDAAEDESSGCETPCSFVGRRGPGRACVGVVCHTSRGRRSVLCASSGTSGRVCKLRPASMGAAMGVLGVCMGMGGGFVVLWCYGQKQTAPSKE